MGGEMLATYINGHARNYDDPWLAHYQFIDHMPSAVVHFAHKHTSHKRTDERTVAVRMNLFIKRMTLAIVLCDFLEPQKNVIK